jgi:hypothetical protein
MLKKSQPKKKTQRPKLNLKKKKKKKKKKKTLKLAKGPPCHMGKVVKSCVLEW